jgi:hypothetical protein
MKKKMVGIFVVTLLLVATGITVAGNMKQTSNSSDVKVASTGWKWYNPAGSWIRSDYQCYVTIMAAGLGKYSLLSEIRTITPQFFNLFPTAVNVTNMYGAMEVKSMNKYDFTQMDYATDASYKVVYYRLWSGTIVFTSEDTMDSTFTAAIYSPDQDPFGEENPTYCFGPYEFSYIRIPVVPPCGS